MDNEKAKQRIDVHAVLALDNRDNNDPVYCHCGMPYCHCGHWTNASDRSDIKHAETD
jgi:hypothetical protein